SGDAVIILGEPGEAGNTVVVVAETASALGEERGAAEKALKVRAERGCTGDEKHEPVVGNGQVAAHGHAVELTTEAELVLSVGPTHSVEPGVVIREGGLQLGGVRSKSKGVELQAVHVGIGIGGWQIDADVRSGDGGLVIQFVADDVDAEAELVDQCIAEEVSFGDAPEAAVQGNIEGKVHVVDAGRSAGLNPVTIGAEGFVGFGVRPEETLGEAIFAAAEIAVPGFGELVIGELSGSRDQERF